MKALATPLLVCAPLLIWALWAAAPAPARADASCIDCHSLLRPPGRRAPALNLLHDTHRGEGVSCIGCHGGEDRPSVRAHSPAAGFAANPVGTCIGCHIGPEERLWWQTQLRNRDRSGAMTSEGDAGVDASREPSGAPPGPEGADAGLPLDGSAPTAPVSTPLAESQIEASYLTSAHAASHLAGTHGASCGGCHRPHRPSSPDDPASSVHWTSIPATCGRCHHDSAVVGEELEDPVSRWGRSVHGRSWAVRGAGAGAGENVGEDAGAARAAGDEPRHGPGCADCHDPHGNTAGAEALNACVTCHEEARISFDEGPHVEAFASRGFLDCVECHGSHEILSADASLITAGRESACRRCHRPGQEAYESIRTLGVALEGADGARRRIAYADEALRAEATEPSAALVDAVHRLAVEEVEEHAAALAEIAARAPEAPPAEPATPSIAGSADGAGGPAWLRPLTLAAVAVLIGLAFTFAWRRRRSGR